MTSLQERKHQKDTYSLYYYTQGMTTSKRGQEHHLSMSSKMR